MKRLTEQHYKKTDGYYMKCSEHCCKEDFSCEDCEKFDELVDRLAAIEDILGDEYELGQISKVVHCKDCEHMWAVSALPGECYCRLRGEVVPRDGYCHRGEAALKAREQE